MSTTTIELPEELAEQIRSAAAADSPVARRRAASARDHLLRLGGFRSQRERPSSGEWAPQERVD